MKEGKISTLKRDYKNIMIENHGLDAKIYYLKGKYKTDIDKRSDDIKHITRVIIDDEEGFFAYCDDTIVESNEKDEKIKDLTEEIITLDIMMEDFWDEVSNDMAVNEK